MNHYDVAAYIWPAYTAKEARTKLFWPNGIGEWETVEKRMKQKPLWGMLDEASPENMEMQIHEALKYGVNVFIYDWYWFDNRPFLEQCLNDGFLMAKNNKQMKFYLMWANHDANYLWDIRNSSKEDIKDTVIWQGKVSFNQFKDIVNRWVEKYFVLDNYYKIDNKPIISIYDIKNLVEGFGGIDETIFALNYFREFVKTKGFEGIHIQFIKSGNLEYDFNGKHYKLSELVQLFHIDSITHYQFCSFVKTDRDYQEIYDDIKNEYDNINQEFDITYYPHVSVGWNDKPRYLAKNVRTLKNPFPKAIEGALKIAKDYADHNHIKLITINSWNEWTESSYLEPDDVYGYGYLEKIQKIFKNDL